MTDKTLSSYLDEYFNWHLAGDIEAREAVDGGELAADLIRGGYCAEPYFKYEKALTCPINKRNEKHCGCTRCESYQFCELLRRESYKCQT